MQLSLKDDFLCKFVSSLTILPYNYVLSEFKKLWNKLVEIFK